MFHSTAGLRSNGLALRSTSRKSIAVSTTRAKRSRLVINSVQGNYLWVPASLKKSGMKTLSVVQLVETASSDEPPEFRKARRLVASTLLDALDDRIKQGKWEAALKVFKLLREQEWYVPDPGTYIKLLRMLGRKGKPGPAHSVFCTMLKEKCPPSVQAYTALLTAFTKSNRMDEAFKIMEVMKRVPSCQPDVHTYTEMIRASIERSDFNQVSELLLEMRSLGLAPNTVTCNILLDAYGKAGMFDAMEQMFKQMIEGSSCTFDGWSLNIFLNRFARVGNIERMEYWFAEIQRLGYQPNVVTFNVLLTAYGKEGLFEKVESVLDFMHKYHYRAMTSTYNTVIDAYGKAGHLKKVKQIYKEMLFRGVKEDNRTFCALLDAFGKQGQLEKVEKVLRQMRNSNIEPDTAVYNAALDAYRRANKKVQMHQVLMEMEDRGINGDKYTKSIISMALRQQDEDVEYNSNGRVSSVS